MSIGSHKWSQHYIKNNNYVIIGNHLKLFLVVSINWLGQTFLFTCCQSIHKSALDRGIGSWTQQEVKTYLD